MAQHYYRYMGPYDLVRFDDGREVMRGATIKLDEDLVTALVGDRFKHIFHQLTAQEAKDEPVIDTNPAQTEP